MDINWPTILLQTLGFLLLVGVLKKFLYGPILEALDKRRSEAQKMMDSADHHHSQAQEMLQKAEASLQDAKEEALQICNEARSLANQQKEYLVEKGKKDATIILKQAQDDVAHEVKKAKEELKAEVAQVAVTISEKLLMREVSPEDRKRYVNVYAKEVEENL